MADRTPREMVHALIDRINRHEWAGIEELVHPDYVEEYPQSGERIRGFANLRKILETTRAVSRADGSIPSRCGWSRARNGRS